MVGSSVYQRRLPRVRASHDRRSRHGHAHSPLALHAAHGGDLFEFDFQLCYAFADKTSVKLELALAAAALGYAAAALSVEVRPSAVQARKRVFEPCKLHLKPRLAGLCAGGEDVQDDLLSVDDFEIRAVLPIALLCGRKLVVENDAVGFERARGGCDRLELARSDKIVRRRFAQKDNFAPDYFYVEVCDKLGKFVEKRICPALRFADSAYADKICPPFFGGFGGQINHLRHIAMETG